jgi:hypothetical protein
MAELRRIGPPTKPNPLLQVVAGLALGVLFLLGAGLAAFALFWSFGVGPVP